MSLSLFIVDGFEGYDGEDVSRALGVQVDAQFFVDRGLVLGRDYLVEEYCSDLEGQEPCRSFLVSPAFFSK